MKCIKCNAEIEQDAKFCNYCGAKQTQEESVHEEQETHVVDGSIHRKLLWAVVGVMTLLLIIGGFFFLGKEKIVKHDLTEADYAYITEAQLPNGSGGIKVHLVVDRGGEQTITIFKNGKFLQKFEKGWYSGGGGTCTDKDIHLVDYNFDGHLDILFGPAADRTGNTLFLWNEASGKFVLSGEMNDNNHQNPLICLSEKTIYMTGSGSYNTSWTAKYQWIKDSLAKTEFLYYVNDLEEENKYSDEKVQYHHTLKDSNGNVIVQGDTESDLPKEWQMVLSKYHKEFEVQRIEAEKEMEKANKEKEEKIKKQLYETIIERHPGLISSPSAITSLKRKEDGTYEAEFTSRGEYDIFDYKLYDIQLDSNGDVSQFGIDVLHIRPTDKKPAPGMTQQEYFEMKLREGRHYGL